VNDFRKVEGNLTGSNNKIKLKIGGDDEKKLEELLSEWITTGDYAPDTVAGYHLTARLIIRSGLDVQDFDQPRVCQEKFAAAAFNPSWCSRTVALHLLRFCSFANWLAHQHITRARHQPLRKLKRRPNQRDVPTDQEIGALLEILRRRYEQARDTPNRQRSYGKDWLLTAILVETGARIAEATGIEKRDLITHDDGHERHHALFLRGSKTDAAERAVLIPAWLADELHRYCRRWQLFGHIFTNRYGRPLPTRTFAVWLSKFCDELELSCHVSPHTFRYRRIMKWICEGMSALEVMTRAGHRDVQMTVYYFNQVRRLMPWVQVSGDVALLEQRRKFWQKRREAE
jgi:integrase